ncbi:MAG: glutamyl-tRNA reductase [Actinomycetota bacterium]
MSVLALGVSHHSAPASLLEQVALSADGVAKLAADVAGARYVTEAVVLSTCNRVEVYAVVEQFHAGVAEVSDLLARHSGLNLDTLTRHLYVHYGDRAVAHLFNVTCGLDSMVVGESQILGQVRLALRTAQEQGSAGRVLNDLLQQALRVGKRAHHETGIDQAGPSLVGVGLAQAADVLDGLVGRRAVLVGAGSMSGIAATALARAGLGSITVANRTVAHARRLADRVGGRAVPLADLAAALADADLLVSCTGAGGVLVGADLVGRVLAGRPQRPLFVLDLALPRDVDPAVGGLSGAVLVDLFGLKGQLDGGVPAREVAAVRDIVAAEVTAYAESRHVAGVAPTVVALRSKAATVVEAELARLDGRLPDLDPGVRAEVAHSIRRVVDKLLHAPTVRVKELAGEPGGGSYAAALRELFDLDPTAVEAVTRPEAGGAP